MNLPPFINPAIPAAPATPGIFMGPVEVKPKPHCCHLGCQDAAEWAIYSGTCPDDYTHSCTTHVGQLLTDASEHRLYRLD